MPMGREPQRSPRSIPATHCIALCCGSKPTLAEAGSGLARYEIASPVARLLPCVLLNKSGSVIDVRFTPDATKLLRSSEMTRCANSGHCVVLLIR